MSKHLKADDRRTVCGISLDVLDYNVAELVEIPDDASCEWCIGMVATDSDGMHKPIESAKVTDTNDINIKDYIEAAYLHGLCVENLDTGELEPPRDISEVQWIVDKLEQKIAQETNKAQQQLLADIKEKVPGKMSDYFGQNDRPELMGFNTAIDQVTAVLEGYQKQGKGGE